MSAQRQDTWRVVILVGGVITMVGLVPLTVGLVVDVLTWVWVAMIPLLVGIPVVVVGIIGLLVSRASQDR